MDAEFCINFKSGKWCPKCQAYVPRSWCFARCDMEKSYPGVATMAVGLAKETVKYVKEGRPKKSDDEIERIRAICEACNDFSETRRCYHCGCRMDIKMTWATTKCPLKKWEQ